MSLNLFLLLAVSAAVVSPIIILLIPRARRSTSFDLLLWLGTPVVAFLAAWYAYGSTDAANPPGGLVVAGTPLLPVVAGALGGALAVNVPLWLLDRFERPEVDEIDWEEQEESESWPDEPGQDKGGAEDTPEREKEQNN